MTKGIYSGDGRFGEEFQLLLNIFVICEIVELFLNSRVHLSCSEASKGEGENLINMAPFFNNQAYKAVREDHRLPRASSSGDDAVGIAINCCNLFTISKVPNFLVKYGGSTHGRANLLRQTWR